MEYFDSNLSIPIILSDNKIRRHYASFLGTAGSGKNDEETIEWLGLISKSTHAEMSVILNYLRRIKKHYRRRKHPRHLPWIIRMPKTMIVISTYKEKLRNSRPCDSCIRIIKYYGIRKVIYSTGLSSPNKQFCMEKVADMELKGESSGNRR